MPAPDHRRIHELEYELGLRDDPPALTGQPGEQIRIGPGAQIPVSGKATTFASVLKQIYTDDLVSRETGDPGTHVSMHMHYGQRRMIVDDGMESPPTWA